jgi:hypothetical protein
MRMTISLQSRVPAIMVARKWLLLCAQALRPALAAAVLPMLLLLGFQPVSSQTPIPTPKSAAGQKSVHRLARPSAAHPVTTPEPASFAPVSPPAPIWPANDQPVQASVVWDSQGLRIEAQNSSLEQILNDVSTATGAKVDGLGADERIFGVYGPGPARDVLSQLLQGSGYNVLMAGEQGQGTPRQILLSVRHAGDTHAAAPTTQASTVDEDTEVDDSQQSQPPAGAPINRPPFTPAGPGATPGSAPRTPQQIMQEMQQRQQEMQQRLQQNQQQNQPQGSPQN